MDQGIEDPDITALFPVEIIQAGDLLAVGIDDGDDDIRDGKFLDKFPGLVFTDYLQTGDGLADLVGILVDEEHGGEPGIAVGPQVIGQISTQLAGTHDGRVFPGGVGLDVIFTLVPQTVAEAGHDAQVRRQGRNHNAVPHAPVAAGNNGQRQRNQAADAIRQHQIKIGTGIGVTPDVPVDPQNKAHAQHGRQQNGRVHQKNIQPLYNRAGTQVAPGCHHVVERVDNRKSQNVHRKQDTLAVVPADVRDQIHLILSSEQRFRSPVFCSA